MIKIPITEERERSRKKANSKICPQCGEKLIGVELEYHKCPECEYEEGGIKIGSRDIAIGIAGATIGGLVVYLGLKS